MSQKRSRVKKFADLRDEIMRESSDKIETKELSSFANKLHRLDEQHFDNMEVDTNNDQHLPLHLRVHHADTNSIEEIEEPVDNQKLDSLFETASESMIEDTDSFKNDYLADFISEAKQYNVEKGFRSDYDTKSNLLKEIKAQQVHDSVDEIEPSLSLVDEDDEIIETLEHFEEPQVKIEETIEFKQNEIEEELEEPVDQFEETIMMQVERLANSELSDRDFVDYDDQELLEATTKLKIQLDEQSEVVKDMETKIDRTSRSMNFLLTILSICLIILIVVFGYILLKLNRII